MDVSQPPSMRRGAVCCVSGLCRNRGPCREPLIRVRQPTSSCWEGIGSTTLHAGGFHSPRGSLEDNAYHAPWYPFALHTLFLFSDERHRGTDSTLRYIIYSPHGTSASDAPSVCSRHLNPTNRFSTIKPPFRGGGSPWGGDASRPNDEITPVQPQVPEG